jgi:hypothetical protein
MHSQVSLNGKPATEPEAGTTIKKPLTPGLSFLIDAVAKMAREVRPPIWSDTPPAPAPLGKLQATTEERAFVWKRI